MLEAVFKCESTFKSNDKTFSWRRDDILGRYLEKKICYDIWVNKLLIGLKQVFSQFSS